MYYLRNLEYFLKKNGKSDAEIENMLARFTKERGDIVNGEGKSAMIVGAAVKRRLGEDMAQAFEKDFQDDDNHTKILQSFRRGTQTSNTKDPKKSS